MSSSLISASRARITQAIAAYAESVRHKSRLVTAFFDRRMRLIAAVWLYVTFVFALLRLAFPARPIESLRDALPTLLAYSLVMAAPILGYLVGRDSFKGAAATAQPGYRFAVIGRWRELTAEQARKLPIFGPTGFMASLLVGMLLNVVFRTLEYFASIPAMGGEAPLWGQVLFTVMSLDLVVTSFFYMAAFAMAQRAIPLFPRMLLFAWVIDVAMQVAIAQQMALAGGTPGSVTVPLINLLDGNIRKVAISAIVWLPYLLLSQRVNVTYRHRMDPRAVLA